MEKYEDLRFSRLKHIPKIYIIQVFSVRKMTYKEDSRHLRTQNNSPSKKNGPLKIPITFKCVITKKQQYKQ